ncbi:phosphatase domain-containing putative toxin [Acinetobacter junii]|uniref:phosphatase domain-containing putative toxin n=1 Tax=Acinetobacter junii TaxID=40215 RepID=UPI003EE3DA32
MDEDSTLSIKKFNLEISGKKILRSLNLKVLSQGITILMGPSGTGKSTLLRTLAGLNQGNPQLKFSGEITYNGYSLFDSDKKPVLVQQKLIHITQTVKENILSHLPNRSSLDLQQQLSLIQQLCDQYDQTWILAKLHQSTATLERHEAKNLAILYTLLSEPALLMIDEPTVGLSDSDAIFVHDLIRKIAKKIPILIVSHHIQRSKKLANYVGLLANGCIQEISSAEAFFEHPQHEMTKQFLRTGSCAELSAEELDRQEQSLMNLQVATSKHLSLAKPLVDVDQISNEPILDCSQKIQSREDTNTNLQHVDFLEHEADAKNQARGPLGFVWLIRGRLAGCPCPGVVRETALDLKYLQDVGITDLVSLTEESFNPDLAAEFGITVLHFPIDDMSVPSLQDAYQFCLCIDQKISHRKSIALHCKAGLGRTGTMLAVYFLWKARLQKTALEAIEYIRSLNYLMIQSEQQIDFLYDFSIFLEKYIDSNVLVSKA